MPFKYLLLIICIAAFMASLWLNAPKQQIDRLQTAATIKQTLEYKTPALASVTNEILDSSVASEIEKKTHKARRQDLERLIIEEGFVSELKRFDGNSDYTGDDTEDNDAGNAGFEDDFPNAHFAYDDDYAEAYSEYSESYSKDEQEYVLE